MVLPRASIVLATLDGETHLARLLPRLAEQQLDGGFELVAIDSDSTDKTRELLEQAGARVTRIARDDFAHGSARNRCAEDARGEFLVFLSQDALPADERFLAELLKAFDDPRVAGAYSRVLPHDDDDPLTRRTVLDAPEAAREVHVEELAQGVRLDQLAPAERARRLRFNNVASAIRRSVFESLPFPDVAFGEDSAWAASALSAGHRIAFAPTSVVLHAHRYSPREAYERYRIDARFLREVHGFGARPDLLSALRGFAFELRRDLGYLARERGPGRLAGLLRAPFLRAAQVWGQYVGSRGPATAESSPSADASPHGSRD